MKRQHAAPDCRGFTLIELLIVVAIISLLISIMLPALGGAREQARSLVCAANLKNLSVAIVNYWTVENGRVPDVITPFNNADFAAGARSDTDLDPYNRELWPQSLPNLLIPQHMADERRVFACPSALNGWPRTGERAYSYWEAARNQPSGNIEPDQSYLREAFGFMDGRILRRFRMDLRVEGQRPTDLVHNSQELAKSRGVFLRDMLKARRPGVDPRAAGPHRGGIYVINRDLDVEYRNARQVNEDLAPNGGGAPF